MIRVFLVEDEMIIREAIRKMVPWEAYGFEFVGEAKDGEMALPLIQKLRPDVLITDIKMPFMDGLTLSKLVMKELPETKIIIISGYDDFKYAKQAINIGVEEYLLKPVSKTDFIEVLTHLKEKFDKENRQKRYYEKFQNELKAYEKNSRRDLFEMMVSEKKDLSQVYEKAEQLHLEIMAPFYNLVLFSVETPKVADDPTDTYSENAAAIQETIDQMFQGKKEYILFRHQMYSYAVLVKGEEEEIETLTDQCIEGLKVIFEAKKEQVEWFVCKGEAVERLSKLAKCYDKAMRLFAFRYMGYYHVFSDEQYENEKKQVREQMNLESIDSDAMNPDIIKNFLCHGLEEEVTTFTQNYLQLIGEEAIKSLMFRQYVMLSIHLCTVAFIKNLGYEMTEIEDDLKKICSDDVKSQEVLREQIVAVLRKGIQLRDERAKGKYKSVIQMAVKYMEEHFADETLTLNKIACVVNVSANHFSALFSQEMKQTFIEYLTGLRMKKAKELLRCTDKRSGEIALEVGYKDAHYFSFLFKKTQGCTPSGYRNQTIEKDQT